MEEQSATSQEKNKRKITDKKGNDIREGLYSREDDRVIYGIVKIYENGFDTQNCESLEIFKSREKEAYEFAIGLTRLAKQEVLALIEEKRLQISFLEQNLEKYE